LIINFRFQSKAKFPVQFVQYLTFAKIYGWPDVVNSLKLE